MVLVVAVALIDDQRRVLLAQRPQGKQLAGLWEFPGGKVRCFFVSGADRAETLPRSLGARTQHQKQQHTEQQKTTTPPKKKLKVDPGETPEEALVRELREELAVAVDPRDLAPLTFASHSYESFHLLMPLFVCRRWRGEPRGAEGQALQWATARALADYAMPAADLPLLAPVRAAMAAAAAAGPGAQGDS
jgi:8-oxo-dGTP diphosphatase